MRDEGFRASDGQDRAPDDGFLGPLGPGVSVESGGAALPQVGGSDAGLGRGFTLVGADTDPAPDGDALAGLTTAVLPELAPWLAERGADVALVRPDRYVFGTAARDAVDTLIGALRAHLI